MTKITGDGGNNQLLGTSGDDIIKGLAGNDYLYGGSGGADKLIGGAGDDAIDGASSDGLVDTLLGGAGNDRISGSAKDLLDGGTGVDFFSLDLAGTTKVLKLDLTGLTKHGSLELADGTSVTGFESGSIFFGSGNDQIQTGGADVHLFGGDGDDKLTGGKIADLLNGGDGDDTVDGGKGSDTVSYSGTFGGAVHVDLSLQGEAQDTGAAGMDVLISIENLTGSGNDDTLLGDSHDNSIAGGGGTDTMTGGGGADTFVFAFAGESYAVAADVITDLSNDDTIDVHGEDADTTTAGDQDFTIVDHFTHHAGQAIIRLDGDGNTRFEMDTNGDGSADEGIIIQGDHLGFDNLVL